MENALVIWDIPSLGCRKRGSRRSLDGELVLLAGRKARLTSSDKRRHAAAQHRSLHRLTRGPFFDNSLRNIPNHKIHLCRQ